MPIPLERLYQFIDKIACEIYGDNVVIYRFWPHGSKNINDLNSLDRSLDWYLQKTRPIVWCVDQEPLQHEYYKQNRRDVATDLYPESLLRSKNLNHFLNIYQKNLLLHSEKNSKDVEKYRADNQLIPVYWWSHALIARDWFRYAKYDDFAKSHTTNVFLIRNRAWSGTREYRLKFADLLVANQLVAHCQTSFNEIDPETGGHYCEHVFENKLWHPVNPLEKFFDATTAPAASSADYVTEDYRNTDIEVVLETLFDDTRLHLTEKTLRPMACAQPFILAGPPCSLKYLREYGFQTFDTVWDESYDTETDPKQRMLAIISLMKTIAGWDLRTRDLKLRQARQIAQSNQQWFFDSGFERRIVDELKQNLATALDEFYQAGVDPSFKEWCMDIQQYQNVRDIISNNTDITKPTWPQVEKVLKTWQSLRDSCDNQYSVLK